MQSTFSDKRGANKDLTLVIGNIELMSVQERRTLIEVYEQACMYAVEQNPEHEFKEEPTQLLCGGVYARELRIPKDTTLVGEIHKHAHINVVSQGRIRVLTEDGITEIQAPCTFISKPGVKRVGFAIEDTVWTVFHATSNTDEEEIRKEFVVHTYKELEDYRRTIHDVGSSGSTGSVNTIPNTASKGSSEESAEGSIRGSEAS